MHAADQMPMKILFPALSMIHLTTKKKDATAHPQERCKVAAYSQTHLHLAKFAIAAYGNLQANKHLRYPAYQVQVHWLSWVQLGEVLLLCDVSGDVALLLGVSDVQGGHSLHAQLGSVRAGHVLRAETSTRRRGAWAIQEEGLPTRSRPAGAHSPCGCMHAFCSGTPSTHAHVHSYCTQGHHLVDTASYVLPITPEIKKHAKQAGTCAHKRGGLSSNAHTKADN
eukprot:543413-Pelagomonas_calceolata.AAC.2